MAPASATLHAAIEGQPVDRPLLAPLIAALAAQVEELDVRAFMSDAGKRSRILAELARSLPIDVLVLDSGSGWDAEAGGLVCDWSGGYPPSLLGAPGLEVRFDATRGRAPVMVDLLARAKAVVPDHVPLAVTVTGPATLAAAAGASLTLPAAVQQVLAAARAVCEAGAAVVFVREDGAAGTDPGAYAQATVPLWGSLRFFRSAGVLHVHGSAAGWEPVLMRPGAFLPVFDPSTAPALAGTLRAGTRPFGVALPATGGPVGAEDLVANPHCALVTHDGDLAGRIPVRDVRAAVDSMVSA